MQAGQRVDDRDAHAVQAARHLVAAAAELAAGVQHGQHDLGRRGLAVLGVTADRDAPAVVDDLAAAVGQQRDVDAGAVAGHGLVDRVVDDLVDEVVQPGRAGGADVHARTPADGFETFENLDVLRVVRQRLPFASLVQPGPPRLPGARRDTARARCEGTLRWGRAGR